MRGWPVSLTEAHLLGEPVELRPVRVSDARTWREIRVRNAPWLRPWEPTNPETPVYRSSLGPYVSMVRAMRREARQGQAIPWVVTFGGEFVGQLTVGSITWGSARSGQVGYWIDEAYAGRGIIPTVLAMAVDHCFGVIGLHRLEASIRPENHASRRVVEKLGFRDEGIRVRQLHINGAWRDHVCYALTAEEVPQGLMPRWRGMGLGSRCGTAWGSIRGSSARVLLLGFCCSGFVARVLLRHTGCGARIGPGSAITLRHIGTLDGSTVPALRLRGHLACWLGEGRIVEQRDPVRRDRRHLGGRAHPPLAPARLLRYRGCGCGCRTSRSRGGRSAGICCGLRFGRRSGGLGRFGRGGGGGASAGGWVPVSSGVCSRHAFCGWPGRGRSACG